LTPEALRSPYPGRRVLITGHTGFQGGWLATWLAELGARVSGFSLAPAYEPNLFTVARVGDSLVTETEGDVRNLAPFGKAWREARPEIVFHVASQPPQREPVETIATNVLGVTNALELARRRPAPGAVVIVGSDRCYEARQWPYAYRESDTLGGDDLYSASKSASELVAAALGRRLLAERDVGVATARAGSALGGGDWGADRLVPNCIRALAADEPVRVRSPRTLRPWQHILDPLSGCLTLGASLLAAGPAGRAELAGAWNFGPNVESVRTVWELLEALLANWGSGRWEVVEEPDLEEAPLQRLATDKAHALLGWAPHWGFAETVAHTVDWYRAYYGGDDMGGWCRRQIAAYMEPAEGEESG
jgi:CDP-glucose 4,6-dehydratase